MFGHSSPQYQTDSSPIVCAVLALESWNYYSGEKAQQPNNFSMFAMHGFIDLEEVEFPALCPLVAREFT